MGRLNPAGPVANRQPHEHELSLLLRDRYGLDVTETDLHQSTTLFDLHQLIEGKRAAIHTTPSRHHNADRGAR